MILFIYPVIGLWVAPEKPGESHSKLYLPYGSPKAASELLRYWLGPGSGRPEGDATEPRRILEESIGEV